MGANMVDMVEKEAATLFFRASPVVMFVGVGAAVDDACTKGCDAIKVLKLNDPAEAMREIVAMHPLLVLLGDAVSPADDDAIFQHATATGTVLLRQRDVDALAAEEWMRESVRAATRLRRIRSL
jgi:hypothetical protein